MSIIQHVLDMKWISKKHKYIKWISRCVFLDVFAYVNAGHIKGNPPHKTTKTSNSQIQRISQYMPVNTEQRVSN